MGNKKTRPTSHAIRNTPPNARQRQTLRVKPHLPLLLVLLLFTGLTLYNSLILPLGEAPDETVHFEVIQFIAQAGHPPATEAERTAAGLRGGFAPLYYTLMALPVAFIDTTPPPELRRLDLKPERLIPEDGLSIHQILHNWDESIPGQGVVLAWRVVRWLSIPLGWLTIILSYAIARLVVPRHRLIALGAAIFVAFLPRFAINSSVINEDNLAIPLAAAVLWLLLKILGGDWQARLFAALGVTLGLAFLTKYYNLVLLPEVLLVLILVAWQGRWPARTIARRWGLATLTLALVAGSWFVFIILRFAHFAEQGWLIGLATALGEPQIIGGLRTLSGGVASYAASAPTFAFGEWFFNLLFRSFWAEFGWMEVFAPTLVYWFLGALTGLAIVGLLYALYLHRAILSDTPRLMPWLLLATQLGLFFGVVLLRYILGQTIDTGQGRHLFPALPAIALFFIIGLVYFVRLIRRKTPDPRSLTWLNVSLGGLLLAIGITFPLTSILPIYYPYLPVTTNRQAINPSPQPPLPLFVDDGFALIDLAAPSTASASEVFPVTLTWQVETEVERDYLISLCLHDDESRPVACWRGHFMDGRYPARTWEAGDILIDTVFIPVPGCRELIDQKYHLHLELWPLLLDSPEPVLEASPLLRQTFNRPLIAVQATESAQNQSQTAELWQRDQRLTAPTTLTINETLTQITYPAPKDDPAPAWTHIAQNQTWLPLPQLETTLYLPCDDEEPLAQLAHFIANPTLTSGIYQATSNPDLPPVTLFLRDRNLQPITASPTFNHTLAPLTLGLPGQPPIDLSQPTGELHSPATHDPLLSTHDTLLPITIRWQAQRWMADPLVISLKLLDKDFAVGGAHVAGLGDRYPNVLWVPSEIVEETYPLQIVPDAPPGLYRLELSLIHQDPNLPAGFTYLPLTHNQTDLEPNLYPATIRILDPAHGTPPPYPLAAQLGDSIQLAGYDVVPKSQIPDPKSQIDLALYWQNTDRIPADYTVFSQLLGPDGQVWAQWDNPPQAGRYPTTAWASNDTVVDRYTLTLRDGAPPGDYRLLVGMYDPTSGERLPITVDGQPQPDHALHLATLSFSP